MNLRPEAVPTLPLPPGIGIYIIHQPNDSEGTAQSHRNTQPSFPRKRESSIDAGYLDSRWSLPSTRSGAGMTIYSRCIDTYALREKGLKPLSLRGERSEGGEAGRGEGRCSW